MFKHSIISDVAVAQTRRSNSDERKRGAEKEPKDLKSMNWMEKIDEWARGTKIWSILTWIVEFRPGSETTWVVFDEEYKIESRPSFFFEKCTAEQINKKKLISLLIPFWGDPPWVRSDEQIQLHLY